jgi:uncharacterized protein YndB with AHSA1/START domain
MTLPRTNPGATTVSQSVVPEAPPGEIWEALTAVSIPSEWLAPEAELEPHEGGEIVCRYEDGEERRGEVELVEEAERLAFRWHRQGGGPSRVELRVDAVAGDTRLTVIEAGLIAETASPLLAASWAPRMRALQLVVGKLVLA